MANMFSAAYLKGELEKTQASIRIVMLAQTGQAPYPQPVPDLAAMERYERELLERLPLATFPGPPLTN